MAWMNWSELSNSNAGTRDISSWHCKPFLTGEKDVSSRGCFSYDGEMIKMFLTKENKFSLFSLGSNVQNDSLCDYLGDLLIEPRILTAFSRQPPLQF
jgi:hypothetical protein